MTKTELKPCPFCGGKPDLGSYSSSGNWIVVCSKCEAETQIYETEGEAVKAWNARTIEDEKVKYENTSYSCKACKNATDKEIKRLREALEEIKKTVEYEQDTVYPFNIYLDGEDGAYILEVTKEALVGKEE